MSHRNIVRIAVPADAPTLQSLYRQLIDDDHVHVTESRIQEVATDTRTRLFVGEVDGAVRATVLVSLCADVMYADQPFAVIENLIVDREYRGNGIGRALFEEVERFCLSRNCSKIMLLSSASRTVAHRFFERVGFRGDVKRGFVKYRRQFAA